MGGIFGKVLGPSGLGLTGSTEDKTTTQKVDRLTQQMNLLRFNELNNATASTGGLDQILANLGVSSTLSDPTLQYLDQATQRASQPGMSAGEWYNNASSNMFALNNDTFNTLRGLPQYQATYNQQFTPFNPNYSQANYSRPTYTTPTYTAPTYTAPTYNQNVNSMTASGQDYFNRILSPQITGQYNLMGMGRSGANMEAQAKGAASIALPIAQQVAQIIAGQEQQRNQLVAANQQQGNQINAANQQQGNQITAMNQQQGNQITSANEQQRAQLTAMNEQQRNQLVQEYLQQQAGIVAQQEQQRNLQGMQQQQQMNAALSDQMGRNFGVQAGYLQQMPQVDIQARNAELTRMAQGISWSDLPRQIGEENTQRLLQGFLTALTGTPFFPGSTANQTGTGNTGLISSIFGGGGGSGAMAGMGTMIGGGGASAALIAASDINFKTDIRRFDSKAFLNTIIGYTFVYKDVRHGTGRQSGIMAQDLEKTDVGKELVIDKPDGKYIDYSKSGGLIMACLADIHDRLSKIEAMLELD